MEKLVLIDGHNLLFQMFYGMPNKILDKNGNSCQGVFGFVAGIIKSISIHKPDYFIVIFDSENNGNRSQINENYKANRIDYSLVALEDNPFTQLDGIKQALEFLDIKYVEASGFEADDLIASYVKNYRNELEIVIQSSDTDFLQLVSENVRVFRYRGKESIIYNIEEVYTKYGVTPNKMAMLKAIVGDKSDNLDGVYKVGFKTASKLLNEYGTIEGIYENIEMIKSGTIRANFIDVKDKIFQNYELIFLDGKYDLPYDLGELRLNKDYTNYKTTNVLKAIDIL